MKTINFLLAFVLLIYSSATFTSCKKETVTKTDTVIKTVNVYLPRNTMTLTPTHDASIFLQDPITDGTLTDNGSGASDLLRVGYSDRGYFVRTLVAFDVSSIPAAAVIDTVILSFTMAKVGSQLVNDTISVYKVSQGWTEGTTDDGCSYGYSFCSTPGAPITTGADVTWNSLSNGGTAWTTPGGSFSAKASATNNNGGLPIFTSKGLVDDVKAWRASASSNFGWILKVKETSVQKNGGEQIRYYSRNASTTKADRSTSGSNKTSGADPTSKPTLTIIYH